MNSEVVSVLVGVVLPPLVDLINGRIYDSKVRFWVSMLAALIVAFVMELIAGTLSLENILVSGSVVFATAQVVYNQYWKRSNKRSLVVPEDVLEDRRLL